MIPAYILDVERDTDMLELALIENVQRENLNPIEVALGYQRLIEECHLTQEEVAAKVGKDRTTITNFLRLLKLSEPVQEALRTKKISMGHARALLALQDHELQVRVLETSLLKISLFEQPKHWCAMLSWGRFVTLMASNRSEKLLLKLKSQR